MAVVNDITVCIATIPPRAKQLTRALRSVVSQTLQPANIIVEYDHQRTGAMATKNRALAKSTTKYTAWLDDDDFFLPNHLQLLREEMERRDVDVVYPWPEMQGAGDPRPDRFGKEFDADELRRRSYIPTTSLFNTQLAQDAGGFWRPPGSPYDDWGLYLSMLDMGATFFHLAMRTWVWVVEGQNTSGDPNRW